MCLRFQLPKKKKKKILDKIDRKGMTVHKVVEVHEDKYFPVYNSGVPYKEGINEAKQVSIYSPSGLFRYMSGFHLFKTKAAAKRLCKGLNGASLGSGLSEYYYKVVTCTIKKSWIIEIGQEYGVDGRKVNRFKLETVIVAKKAIFPDKKKRSLKCV